MEVFFSADIFGEFFTLNKEESKHIVRVLRKENGDRFFVTNGKGSLFEVEIAEAHPKNCVLKILQEKIEYGKRASSLHIAIAPTKNINRYEWFLEKATEIGIDKISPLICTHSERKVIKPERLEKVIIAAAKQSVKAYFPTLLHISKFELFLQNNHPGNKLIAVCSGKDIIPIQKALTKGDTIILIGPEGGFSPEEIVMAKEYGFKTVSLGDSRLRTETAGLVACVLFNA
jgi:16S rRNA (uracil1498-N3)-methyltransferase